MFLCLLLFSHTLLLSFILFSLFLNNFCIFSGRHKACPYTDYSICYFLSCQYYLLSLIIFVLNILVANSSIIIVYTQNITIFCVVIVSILLFKIPFVIVNAESNGKNSQIFAYVSPNISFGKYIPLVKHTN